MLVFALIQLSLQRCCFFDLIDPVKLINQWGCLRSDNNFLVVLRKRVRLE
jgi:hypothetical protein